MYVNAMYVNAMFPRFSSVGAVVWALVLVHSLVLVPALRLLICPLRLCWQVLDDHVPHDGEGHRDALTHACGPAESPIDLQMHGRGFKFETCVCSFVVV